MGRDKFILGYANLPAADGDRAAPGWTNLYFPYTGLLDGDPIAGPLAEQFGVCFRGKRAYARVFADDTAPGRRRWSSRPRAGSCLPIRRWTWPGYHR